MKGDRERFGVSGAKALEKVRRGLSEIAAWSATAMANVSATVVLRHSEIAFLDRLCADITANSGQVVQRAGVIRTLIDALAESGIDVTRASSEDEIKALLLERLEGRPFASALQ